jgi:hypothetical protein
MTNFCISWLAIAVQLNKAAGSSSLPSIEKLESGTLILPLEITRTNFRLRFRLEFQETISPVLTEVALLTPENGVIPGYPQSLCHRRAFEHQPCSYNISRHPIYLSSLRLAW